MYNVLVCSQHLSGLATHVVNYFKGDTVASIAQLQTALQEKRYRILVLDGINEEHTDIALCQNLLQLEGMKNIPLMVLASKINLQDKLKAFEIGCDDIVEAGITGVELCARITKSIFNRIAHDQLHQRLDMASETARNAMVDNSDLGANIQFLLAVHDCDNLDQLGQQLFSTLARYGLVCSLQLRSTLGIKNMEAHGMAKELESQLLYQLKDSKRYIDFGPRTIVNFNRVSLLIKNMPLNDPEKYGSIKDNTFCLLQGLNARIMALEDKFKIVNEKDALRKLSLDVNRVVGALKDTYQEVMRNILTQVENASERLQLCLPKLALSDADEKYIDAVTERLLSETNRIFGEGLKVDELFEQLEKAVTRSLEGLSVEDNSAVLSGSGAEVSDGNDVVLF